MADNKVVRITRDYRLAVIAAVRSIALLGLLALAVFSVWRYRDDFNADSAKQFIAYIKSASYSDVLFEDYDTDSGLTTAFAPLGVGMAVVESDFYHYVTGSGRVEFSHQLKYSQPVIKTQDNWALIYDSGNTGYSVVTGYAVTFSGQAPGTIITGAVSESGSYAIVSKSPGYRSSVTVYSKKHKQLCSWETPSEYIMMISISPDGKRFATISALSNGEDMVFRLVCRNTQTGDIIFENNPDCGEIYSLKHTKDGNLMIFTDQGIAVIKPDGKEKAAVSLNGNEAVAFSHYEQDNCLVVYKGERINTYRALVYDADCDIIYSEEISGVLRSCDCRQGTISFLLDSSLVWYSEDVKNTVSDISARNVISMNGGAPVLVYTDRIERVKNSELQLDS